MDPSPRPQAIIRLQEHVAECSLASLGQAERLGLALDAVDALVANQNFAPALTILSELSSTAEFLRTSHPAQAGRYYETLGLAAHGAGDNSGAEKAFARGLAVTQLSEAPRPPLIALRFSLWANLAGFYFERQDLKGCLQVADHALHEATRISLTNALGLRQLWHVKGLAHLQNGEPTLAGAAFDKVESLFVLSSERHPLRARNLHLRAQVHFSAAEPRDASYCLRRAIDVTKEQKNPTCLDTLVELQTHLTLALAADLQLRIASKEALTILRTQPRLTAADPHYFATPHTVMALHQEVIGRSQTAQSLLRRVIAPSEALHARRDASLAVMRTVRDFAQAREVMNVSAATERLANAVYGD